MQSIELNTSGGTRIAAQWFAAPAAPRLAFEYRNRKTGKAAARVSYDLDLERP